VREVIPYTGYRLPLIVISPFTKKNYVSHTVADYTAMLKFIETRFNVPALTKRDAAQMDMTEFFDFENVPWATPPTQASGGVCIRSSSVIRECLLRESVDAVSGLSAGRHAVRLGSGVGNPGPMT
jgi:phospholipase C